MRNGSEQRRHSRLDCVGTAEVFLQTEESSVQGRLSNLSLEGCLLILQNVCKLKHDDLLELAFNVNGLPFRVRGQVKAIRTPTEFGLHFPALSGRSRQGLNDLIEELRGALPDKGKSK